MFEGWGRARAVLKFHHSFLDSTAVESLVYPDNNLPHKTLVRRIVGENLSDCYMLSTFPSLTITTITSTHPTTISTISTTTTISTITTTTITMLYFQCCRELHGCRAVWGGEDLFLQIVEDDKEMIGVKHHLFTKG